MSGDDNARPESQALRDALTGAVGAVGAGRAADGSAADGDPLGIAGHGEFAILFHGSPVAMAYTPDAHCAVVLRNSAMHRIIPLAFDWQAWRSADGAVPDLYVEGQPLAVDRQPLRRAAAHGESTPRLEVELRWPNREAMFLLVSAEPLRDASGAPRGAIGVVLDITGEKRIAQARALLAERETAARRDAETANHAKDQLLALLGHEMRNPLNALSTAAEVLKRAAPGSREAQSAVQIIGRQTRQLADLLDDVGEVGRALADDIALLREPLELGALVERCVGRARALAAVKAQTLEFERAEVWIDADAARIAQALDRLLDTAVRATPPGGCIGVRMQVVHGPTGAEAMIDVQDDGFGITPELMPRASEPFVQGPRGPDRPGGGIGIGLTLVRRLVAQHGGRVEARAGRGGSRFEVHLPAVAAPGAAPAPERPAVAPARSLK